MTVAKEKEEEALPRADEVEVYPLIKSIRKMITYIIIGRIKDSDSNPWSEFETANQEIAKSKLAKLLSDKKNANKTFKIETRTLFNEQIEEFNKSQENIAWIEKVNSDINS